jgi:hypothetical protein
MGTNFTFQVSGGPSGLPLSEGFASVNNPGVNWGDVFGTTDSNGNYSFSGHDAEFWQSGNGAGEYSMQVTFQTPNRSGFTQSNVVTFQVLNGVPSPAVPPWGAGVLCCALGAFGLVTMRRSVLS